MKAVESLDVLTMKYNNYYAKTTQLQYTVGADLPYSTVFEKSKRDTFWKKS